ncbi:hypothetical protein K8R43_06100 [archaeon]|nr:hypothetical protein [archaeon]
MKNEKKTKTTFDLLLAIGVIFGICLFLPLVMIYIQDGTIPDLSIYTAVVLSTIIFILVWRNYKPPNQELVEEHTKWIKKTAPLWILLVALWLIGAWVMLVTQNYLIGFIIEISVLMVIIFGGLPSSPVVKSLRGRKNS